MPWHAASRAWMATGLLSAGAVALSTSCTRATACDFKGCTTGTTLTARLAIARAALDGADLSVCRNDACSSRGDALSSGTANTTAPAAFALRGALAGTATIEAIDTATSRLTIALDDPGAAQTDGDRYAITVRDVTTGATLYAFDRAVRYDRAPVPDGCEARCTEAEVRVYPSSPSGLTCSAHACAAGLTLRGTTRVARHDMEGGTLRVCRNATCAGLTIGALPTATTDQSAFVVHGALDAAIVISLTADAVFGVTVVITADPADLADGDAYQVELLNSVSGRVLGFAMPVTYAESFKDGAECDVVPCRTAEGALAE